MSPDPGPWGSHVGDTWTARSGARARRVVALVALATVLAVATTGLALYLHAEGSLTRVPVDGLADPDEDTDDGDGGGSATAQSDATGFLVVGSDTRSADDHADDVALGDIAGQRSDVMMYVSLTNDRDGISVISLPRDLLVERNGRRQRLSDTFEDGANNLVATVQEEYGLDVHHYAHVTFDGFIDAVDTLGGVDLCLEDDLVDPDAGADLAAGCQRLDPAEALAFVRSRQGERGDYERIERQQRFLRAAVDELTQRRVLTNVPQLFGLVEDVADNVTTDDRLNLREMLGLADELRDVVDGDVPMVSVPTYPDSLGAAQVMRIYGPGARALFADVRAGRQVADRGTRQERATTSVALWSGGRHEELEIVGSVLLYGGFEDRGPVRPGPEKLDAGAITTVYARTEDDVAAARVAALLGAPVRELPDDVDIPGGADTVVAVGRDARPRGDHTLAGSGDRVGTQQDDSGGW